MAATSSETRACYVDLRAAGGAEKRESAHIIKVSNACGCGGTGAREVALELGDRQRLTDVKALGLVATPRAGHRQFLGRLNALGDDATLARPGDGCRPASIQPVSLSALLRPASVTHTRPTLVTVVS